METAAVATVVENAGGALLNVGHTAMHETTVFEIQSPDGERELEVALLSNGMYQFTEWAKQAGDEYTGAYTAVAYLSGLYETKEAAEADAFQMLPWLREFQAGTGR